MEYTTTAQELKALAFDFAAQNKIDIEELQAIKGFITYFEADKYDA